MGSFASRPKAPPVPEPQVVYLPAPQPVQAYTPPPAPAPVSVPDTGAAAQTTTAQSTAEEGTSTASEARTQDLLRRPRGRSGTVQTSFRGLLSQAPGTSHRKTLLGE